MLLLFVRFHLAGQTIEIFRRMPLFIALDVDNEALVQAGLWKQCAVALAGPLTNFGLALLTGWVLLGLEGAGLALDFVAASFRGIATFLLMPFGLGNPVRFFQGPLQETLALARASGIQGVAAWWILLNAFLGVANLIPLPALDGGLVLVSILMSFRRRRDAAMAMLSRWREWAVRVVVWLPWMVIGMAGVHIINLLT